MLQKLFKNVISRLHARLAPSRARRLLILDNGFPDQALGFRLAEFNHYLKHYRDSMVRTVAGNFDSKKAAYSAAFPALAGRVKPWSGTEKCSEHLAYFVFISNLQFYLPWLNEQKIPFVFTLYPGGNFGFGYEKSDKVILEALASPWLRKIIVTSPGVKEYLQQLAGGRTNLEKLVEEIHGVVIDSQYFAPGKASSRRRFGIDKDTFDVCFVAYKIMPQAINKGFPQFLAAARILSATIPGVRFHVVGNLGPEDGELEGIDEQIFFYGLQPNTFFKSFYAGMDAIVAPSIGYTNAKNNGVFFDGFPVSACVEASLCGVAMIATDPFGLNRYFEDGKDMLITTAEPAALAGALSALANDPARMKEIAEAGEKISRAIYHPDIQLARRRAVLDKCLSE